VAPELIAQTKETADKLALYLSQLVKKDQDSPNVHPSDFCIEQCSILHGAWKLYFATAGLGLAPLLMFPFALRHWQIKSAAKCAMFSNLDTNGG